MFFDPFSYIMRFSSLLVTLFLFQGCMKDDCTETKVEKAYVPIYQPFDKFRDKIEATSPKTLRDPGKIMTNGNYLYINEKNKGIHVVDNSDPSSPRLTAFIPIPGNVDMTMCGNTLYADSYMDMIVLDLSNPSNPRSVGRHKDVFPYDPYQYLPYEGKYIRDVDPSKGVVVDWKHKEVEAERPCQAGQDGETFFVRSELEGTGGPTSTVTYSYSSGGQTKQNTMTKAGSMSRFATKECQHLYTVKGDELGVFNIANASSPSKETDRTIDHGIETIFSYENKLFIGADDGMHLYDVSSPSSPTSMSTYEHVEQCDPVIVQDDYAYVTLRSGTNCGGWINELQVVDVSDPSSPREVEAFDLQNPHGLDINGDKLYVCDGDAGLAVFDASNTPQLQKVRTLDGIHGYDAIALEKTLIVVGEDGLHQYDRSEDAQNLEKLGSLPVFR